MARRKVLEVTCDRCNRTETQQMPDDPMEGHEVELSIRFRGEEHRFSDLCTRCREACANYFKSITKQRDDKEEAENPEPPSETDPEAKKKGGFLGRVAG